MDYKVVSKFMKVDPESTEVRIVCENPYTIITRDLQGDRQHISDDGLIQEVLSIVANEANPQSEFNRLTEEINRLDDRITMITKSMISLKDIDSSSKDELLNSYAEYKVGRAYRAGEVVNCNGVLYQIKLNHTSTADLKPDKATDFYVPYFNPEDPID